MNVLDLGLKIRVFDVEILHPVDEVEGGWSNPQAMGISCVVGYDFLTDRYHIYDKHNLSQLEWFLNNADMLVSFNGVRFDTRVLEGAGLILKQIPHYDIMLETWRAANLGEEYQKDTHNGFGLDACAEGSLGLKKSGHGAHAPIMWQEGKYAQTIDYNLNDVYLTKRLFEIIDCYGNISVKSKGTFYPKETMHLIPFDHPSRIALADKIEAIACKSCNWYPNRLLLGSALLEMMSDHFRYCPACGKKYHPMEGEQED